MKDDESTFIVLDCISRKENLTISVPYIVYLPQIPNLYDIPEISRGRWPYGHLANWAWPYSHKRVSDDLGL